MGLRCSLLGHDFGDFQVDHEREEQGDEVVLTVKEYEKCQRCGIRNVISENTEVTHRRSDDSADDTSTPDVDSTDTENEPSPTDPPKVDAGEAVADTPPSDEDGAEILEDDDVERQSRQWPTSDDVGPPVERDADSQAWPEHDDTPDSNEVGSGGGVDDRKSRASQTSVDDGESEEISRVRSAPTPGEENPLAGVPTEFFCPNCSFVAPESRGSLRTGDICPECKKGYLGERRR